MMAYLSLPTDHSMQVWCTTLRDKVCHVKPVGADQKIKVVSEPYSLFFNTSHGVLIKEKLNFPPNPFIPAWSMSKSLLCLLLHPGLKPFLFTSKQ